MKSDDFEKRVEDEQVEGWSVKEDGDERVVLVKRGWGTLGGHVLVAALTFWTFGLGNVIYAAYKYFVDTDEKVIRDQSAAGA